jgi:signal transduction histidine kinase
MPWLRGSAGNPPPRKQECQPTSLVREVIELIRGEAVKNGVSLQMELGKGLPLIKGDRVQLQQVVLNLIISAPGEAGAVQPVKDRWG